MKKLKNKTEPSAPISYGRLVFEAIPELLGFQLPMSVMLAIAAFGLNKLMNLVAESGGAALTTANLSDLLLSWRGPVLLLLGLVLVAVFAVFEIFANIHLCDDILNGRQVRIFGEVGKGFRSLLSFLCPGGILVLLYIFIAAPLCGVGFSISLTENFYIPNFIMEVVRANPLFNTAYWIFIAALALVGLGGIFTLHGTLLDGKKPSEAFKASLKALKENRKNFLLVMLLTLLVLVILNVGLALLQDHLLTRLDSVRDLYPQDYHVGIEKIKSGDLNETDNVAMAYRFLGTALVIVGGYLNYVVLFLSGSYVLLRLTRCHMEYTHKTFVKWPSCSKRRGYPMRILFIILTLVLLIVASLVIGVFFDEIFAPGEPVRIVAHRTGGVMAPENSTEGIALSIEHGCYACETDTQRTGDGYYIINHDNDFGRLTGVTKAPGDMTLKEISELIITDPVSGKKSKVPTLEDLLDAVKGKTKLFIELKGVSADRQMVDDVVKLVREKDCLENVALISLKYDVIDYAETQYPEFETGVLMFGGLGDVSRINCDMLILEEEMATDDRIDSIHKKGKDVYVWTINTEKGLYQFLDSDCDGIITDQIELAQSVQKTLDERSDVQLLKDKLGNLWR